VYLLCWSKVSRRIVTVFVGTQVSTLFEWDDLIALLGEA
jgi:hypothetical protein